MLFAFTAEFRFSQKPRNSATAGNRFVAMHITSRTNAENLFVPILATSLSLMYLVSFVILLSTFKKGRRDAMDACFALLIATVIVERKYLKTCFGTESIFVSMADRAGHAVGFGKADGPARIRNMACFTIL